MSDAFDQNKRRFGKAMTFCSINSGFAIAFMIAFAGLGKNECYAAHDSTYPVTPDTEDAINVTLWFNMTIFLGLVFYTAGALSSLGHLAKHGPFQRVSLMIEKVSRYTTYAVFIAVHVMRLCHSG